MPPARLELPLVSGYGEQEPIDGEVVPEGEASAAEEVAIEAAPEQPLSPGFSNLQVELGAEREFAFEPEAET